MYADSLLFSTRNSTDSTNRVKSLTKDIGLPHPSFPDSKNQFF
jgi:hypothetical protein